MNVKDIRRLLKRKLNAKDFNDEGMIELVGVSFTANEPIIFGNLDNEYIKAEIEWYESMSRNVKDIPYKVIPKIWKDISSSKGKINSNYGWCIYSRENGNQYVEVLSKLLKDQNTRQASMIYNRPTMHSDAIKDGMQDFMCTNAVTYKVVRELGIYKLHATVQMRSNDVIFGYKNDYAWQKYVLDKLVKDLKRFDLEVEAGDIYWQVASIHVYPRHFKFLDDS